MVHDRLKNLKGPPRQSYAFRIDHLDYIGQWEAEQDKAEGDASAFLRIWQRVYTYSVCRMHTSWTVHRSFNASAPVFLYISGTVLKCIESS